ncbi:MAG: RNA polymerase sigma-I factor [Syntrophomonadaceae bacterium]
MDSIAHQSLLDSIRKIQNGDQNLLEKLIDDYRPFIMKTVAQFCKRMLVWGHDDELSIGLMAFDSAVNTYDPDKKIPFQSYCRVVIVNRLKDYARTQVKYENLIHLCDEDLNKYFEGQIAHEDYLNKAIEAERREEMEHLESLLSEYSIGFEDLVDASPKHKDSRKTLLEVAHKLAQNEELWKMLNSKKQLPLNELEKICGVKRKTLERGRKFIIASAVLLYNINQFIYLGSYINFG